MLKKLHRCKISQYTMSTVYNAFIASFMITNINIFFLIILYQNAVASSK